MECLEGVLSRVLWHEVPKWTQTGIPFLIGKLHNGSIVKGDCRKPVVGDTYRMYGEWRDQKGRMEQAFEFSSYEPIVDESDQGMIHYLKTYVPTIGVVKATAIAEVFGVETLRILRTTPERAAEVQGISPENVEAIRKHFTERTEIDPAAYARLVDLFKEHRVPRTIIKRLLKDWGSDAPSIVTDHPYLLLAYPRLGWKTVDAFALTTVGYDPAGIERHEAAIGEGLERLADQGHTYGSRLDIEEKAFALLGGRPAQQAWAAAVVSGLVYSEDWERRRKSLLVDLFGEDCLTDTKNQAVLAGRERCAIEYLASTFTDSSRFALPKYADAERVVAERLAALSKAARPLPFMLESNQLNEDQAKATQIIAENGVCCLVGPPGVGKSWTAAAVIDRFMANGVRNIRVMAPTGKASKRAAELLARSGISTDRVPCTTIHRALGPVPSSAPIGVSIDNAKVNRGREPFAFSHGPGNPLEVEVVFIDELSMVDCRLAAALLSAIPLGCRVVFVGDHNQLPSVGPGAVLRDMMEAGIPTAVLTKIERSDSAGRVVHACHAIKDGDTPFPSKRIGLPADNWVHIELSDPDQIAQTIVELHEAKATFPDLLWDFQVVSAEKGKKKFACGNLNRLLSEKLNPPPKEVGAGDATQGNGWAARDTNESDDDESGYGPPFRKGDKIVRTKNGLCDLMREASPEDHVDWRWRGQDWSMSETDIVNGDMGRIEDIVFDEDEGERWVVVQFRTPERLCRLAYSECHLIQAYALTCHKSQGSGFPFVIVPVHESFYWDRRTHTGLWCRELFYTAISRTERLLVTVGQFSSIRSAIGRRTIHQRRTRLVDLIKRVMPAPAPASAPIQIAEQCETESEEPAFSIPTPQGA
jgi:exodeoxyribonuclease V alpha subunit